MIDELLRHLVIGWAGFVALLLKASMEGHRLPPELITKLTELEQVMAEVISKQRDLPR